VMLTFSKCLTGLVRGHYGRVKPTMALSGRIYSLKMTRFLYLCLILAAMTLSSLAGPNYQLYVNGVHFDAPSIFEKGLPYFPVDVLAGATGVRIVSYSANSVRLAGSPVDFVPVVRQGRPYLPAEAFALASGSGVETDQTRGIVMYRANLASSGGSNATGTNTYNPAGSGGSNSANPSAANTSGVPGDATYNYNFGPGAANPGVTAGDEGPEAPVAAPPTAVMSSPNTEGIHETVVDAMKSAQEITYAQRWLKHKMYWANQLDPANSPYLQVNIPGAAFPMNSPHPWSTP
jgi:hypothetical protein